jgi:uncharacterized Zn-binding protein involved in type VI secretion
MGGIAGGNGRNPVLSATGSGPQCKLPMTSATAACSPNVFINGYGVVREGDAMAVHNMTGCGTEAPTLSTFSSTVKVNGKGAGRVGDNYAGDGSNIIQPVPGASSNVFAGN